MAKITNEVKRADELASELQRAIETMISRADDYDIERILKRSEAELMDLRHNLSLVQRLAGG